MENKEMRQCQGITKKHQQCKKRIVGCHDTHCFCSLHKSTQRRVYEKEACPVCFENNVKHILDCGHWVHKECIILSGKAECPICRTMVSMTKLDMKKLNKRKRQLDQQQLEEDEIEIQAELTRGFFQSLVDDENNSLGGIVFDILQTSSIHFLEIIFEDYDDT